MITDLTINQVATFTNEVKVSNLKAINFFYGSNGTGKSTISKLLASKDSYPTCSIAWQNNYKLKIIVYNEDFVQKYFYQSPNLPGIYTIGEGASDIETQIKEKKDKIDGLNNDLIGLNKTLETKKKEGVNNWNNFKENCWSNVYLKYQNDFDDIFTGFKNSKEKLAQYLLNISVGSNTQIPDIKTLKEKFILLYKEELNNIDNIPLIDKSILEKLKDLESNQILKTKIVGKQDVDIARMIHKLQNHDWVSQGKIYYEKNYDVSTKKYICPFCQQSTSEDFRNQLEAYFDETYKFQISSLNKLIEEYEQVIKDINSYFDKLFKMSENKYLNEKKEILKDKSDLIKSFISENITKLQNKNNNPSLPIELSSIIKHINEFNKLINEINNDIINHNSLFTNKKQVKNKLAKDLWIYFSQEIISTTSSYNTNKENIDNAIRSIQSQIYNKNNEIFNLKNEISELEKQIKSVKPTVESINKFLDKFGFNGFRLEATVDEKHYRVVREDGSSAKETLSEGERNFIVFLYFYSMLQGVLTPNENITEDKIVVFDDPVSSLDADVLYIVSILIKKLLFDIRNNKGNIKQVFIFTHNQYFFKEVSHISVREKGNKRNDTSYYIIKKSDNISQVVYYETNPIKTSYQLLWDEIKKENIDCVSLQNSMRRIIEFYFNTLANLDEEELINSFEDDADKIICRSLIAWINIGSHEVFDDINFSVQKTSTEKYKAIFKKVFEITGHISHYRMMMGTEENN